MIIDKYEVEEVCFREYPLRKYLRFTAFSWYLLDSSNTFSLISVFTEYGQLEHMYQKRLKKNA